MYSETTLSSCEEPRLGLNQLNDVTDRRRVPLQDEDHPGNDPHLVPAFSRLCFGTLPERFRSVSVPVGSKKSSFLNRAPKIRDFVLLKFRDSFLVTLPSISSETCVMYSSLILGKDVFRDWPLLGCSSCVFLATAAKFRLFPNVAIFWREKVTQSWRLNSFLLITLRTQQKMWYFRINHYLQSVQSTDSQSDVEDPSLQYFRFSYL